MSLLLEHIEANIDDIISDENQLFSVTNEDLEEFGLDSSELEEGLLGAKIGAAGGAAAGTAVGAGVGAVTGRLKARKIPQFVAYKRSELKMKDFVLRFKNKDKPANYQAQLAVLKKDAAKRKNEWKAVRNKIINRHIGKGAAVGAAVGTVAGGAAGAAVSGAM